MSDSTACRERAAAAVASALADDPFYRTLTAAYADRPDERHRRLTAYVQVSMHEGERYGRLVVEPGGDGAAIWTLPVTPEQATAMGQTKYQALREVVGEPALAAYQAMVANMEAGLEGCLPEGAWYLSILGIDPARQGRGLGRTLLARTIAEADRHGVSTYLETFSERSIAFYGALGYAPQSRFHEAYSGSDYWLLIRPPQAV